MKKHIIFFVLLMPAMSFGQYSWGGFTKEFFFGRQPSARAEAMGRSYVSIDEDLSTAYFNPAGIATIQGIEVTNSFASPYYMLSFASYNYFSVGYKIKDYLSIGISRNNYTQGDAVMMTDINANYLGTFTAYQSNYCLTLASQPIRNLYVGVNTNYYIWNLTNKSSPALYFDFGIIKKFEFGKTERTGHSVSLGASVVNLNSAKVNSDFMGGNYSVVLPVISRYGANYQFSLNQHLLFDTLKTFRFLVQGEIQKLFNSKYESAIRGGAEIMLFEILSLRGGYYRESEFNYNYPGANKGYIGGITYGFGLQIPLHKLTRVPLNINLDYTSLPQPSYTTTDYHWENFHSFNLRLNWIMRHKKQTV